MKTRAILTITALLGLACGLLLPQTIAHPPAWAGGCIDGKLCWVQTTNPTAVRAWVNREHNTRKHYKLVASKLDSATVRIRTVER